MLTRRIISLSLVLAVLVTAPAAQGAEIRVMSELDRTVFQANRRQKAYLRVGLSGLVSVGVRQRASMNVAIVIDKSGSMAGRKIRRAKEAAIAALDQMHSDDIVSVVAYDSTVKVLVPATKVSDRAQIIRGINRLRAGGSTALFAGMTKGAAEVRKFLDPRRVNRVVLLSDGRANVGPSSPAALGRLGRSLRREGIAVTTVGLGLDWNEDLMFELASKSGGGFHFVEDADGLEDLYREGFASLASIVAKEVVVRIRFAEGFRPVRALMYGAEVIGQDVTLSVAQIYGGTVQDLIIEVETPNIHPSSRPVAEVEVSWYGLASESTGRATQSVATRFSDNPFEVESGVNRDVMVAVVERLAEERSQVAVQLHDQGKIEEARRKMDDTARYLLKQSRDLRSERLKKQQRLIEEDSRQIKKRLWKKSGGRKGAKRRQMDMMMHGF